MVKVGRRSIPRLLHPRSLGAIRLTGFEVGVAIVVAAALGVSADYSGFSTPAVADNGTAAADNEIDYTATTTDRTLTITTTGGSLRAQDGVFTILDNGGNVLAGTELTFRFDDFVFPVATEIRDRTATLTPQFDLDHARYQPVDLPFQEEAPWKNDYDREQSAFARLASTISMSGTLGTMIGTIAGAAVGCALGGIAGATIASAAIVGLFGLFLPAALVGCIGGVIALSAIGAVTGALLIGAPIAIMAGIQYFTTLNGPLPNQGRPAATGDR